MRFAKFIEFVVVRSHYFGTLLFHLHLSTEKHPKLLCFTMQQVPSCKHSKGLVPAIAGFHCHAIKIKIENHSMNEVKHSPLFSKQTLFSKRTEVASACICTLIKHAKISQSQSLLEWFK